MRVIVDHVEDDGGANLPRTLLEAALGMTRTVPASDCCREGATWLRATDALPRLAA